VACFFGRSIETTLIRDNDVNAECVQLLLSGVCETFGSHVPVSPEQPAATVFILVPRKWGHMVSVKRWHACVSPGSSLYRYSPTPLSITCTVQFQAILSALFLALKV
jgi:hypothetical protein